MYLVAILLLKFLLTCLTFSTASGSCGYFNLPHCQIPETTTSTVYTHISTYLCSWAHPALFSKTDYNYSVSISYCMTLVCTS